MDSLKKKATIVMLSTEKASKPSMLVLTSSGLSIGTVLPIGLKSDKGCVFQHLYVCSMDEIKEGDWFIKMNYNGGKPTLYQESKKAFMNSEWLNSSDVKDCFKIITTTNNSLNIITKCLRSTSKIDPIEDDFMPVINKLPNVSDSFIQAFIKAYNEGNPITEVMVEYEEYGIVAKNFKDVNYKLKLRGNEIIITKLGLTKDNILEIIKEESELSGVRQYTCINGFGYSQFERNIADRILKLKNYV